MDDEKAHKNLKINILEKSHLKMKITQMLPQIMKMMRIKNIDEMINIIDEQRLLLSSKKTLRASIRAMHGIPKPRP